MENTVNNATGTTTRRDTLTRLVLAMIVTLLLGTMLVPSAEAAKNGPKSSVASVKARVGIQRQNCQDLGGIMTTEKVGKATVTQCSGGGMDGQRCVNEKKSTKCHQTFTPPPSGPAAPPTDGVNEQPTGGGQKPDHGDAGPPADTVEHPSAGDPIIIR